MNARSRLVSAAAAVMVLIASAAACSSSGDSDEVTAPTDNATTSTSAPASPPSAPASSSQSAGQSVTLKATVTNTHGSILVFVPLTVSGKKFAWVVDSGASSSILDAKAAKRAGLDSQPVKGTVTTLGCTVKPTVTEVTDWAVGNTKPPTTRLITQDLAFKNAKAVGLPIGGLLGADFQLGTKVVRIDYAGEKVVFDAQQATGGKTVDLTVKRAKAGMTVTAPATVGSTKVIMQLDTGASGSAMGKTTANKLGLPTAGKPLKFNAAGCPATVQPVKLTKAKLGDIALPDATINRTDTGAPTTGAAGLLGSDILSTFKTITIDYTQSKLTLGG